MKSITPHDCHMALLPPAALVINENGIVFNESATLQLALTENSLFKINIDGSQLYFEETTSTDFFRVLGLINTEKAFCYMPGLFEYIGLKEPSVYLINPIDNGMRKLIFDHTIEETLQLDGIAGTSGCGCNIAAADGMHDDTTDEGFENIKPIIMDVDIRGYVPLEKFDFNGESIKKVSMPQAKLPGKKRGPKPGFKRAKATVPAAKKVTKTRKNAKAV